jgi:HEAT repeat protein
LLKDKDDAVRTEAVLAICGTTWKANKDATPVLIELLGDPIERIRVSAAGALSWRGAVAEPVIPALVKTITQDASPEVRHNAARALRTGGPRGVDALLGMLDDKSVQVRRTAISVFEFQYPNAQPYETPLRAVPKLVALLEDESPEVRKSAAIAIVRIGDVPLGVVFRLLRHKDVVVRRVAAENLSFGPRFETDEFRAALFECMKGDRDFCREHPGVLSRAGPKSIPILITLLDDRSPAVRGHTASALGALGPAAKEAVGPLKRLLSDKTIMPRRDDDERVCHCAAEALNRILGDKDYREGLPELAPDGL